MERIKLTKDEKRVLRLVENETDCPETYPAHVYVGCILSLERKGLIKGAYTEGGMVMDARLTNFGKGYVFANPKLRNPLPWGAIWAAIAACSGIAGLFIVVH
ncbi:MAG: hypothetical protein K2H70_03255 [Bacteroidales bacterium]|nr:hypothetical protein [Bacteroidales bacterium]